MAAMEFGRVDDLEGLDLSLPADHPSNPAALAGGDGAGDLRVGMPTWTHAGLRARLGADGRGQDPLAVHARAVPANELNSTFYGYTPARFERWRGSVPEGFLFCPKLPAAITHEHVLEGADAAMAAFVEASEALGSRRGPLWFALPPYVGPAAWPALRAFVERWAPRVELAVELREARWFTPRWLDEVAALLEAHRATLVMTDAPGRRDVLPMRLTAPRAFVRFLGNGLHPTDFQRLDAWAARLAAWAEGGLERAFLFLHQRDEALTVDLAEHFEGALAARGRAVLGPWRERTGWRPAPVQGDLFA